MPESIVQVTANDLRDLELEKSVVAALAVRPAAYFDVRGIIMEDVFTSTETMAAFNAIEAAYEENRQLPNIDDWEPVGNHVDGSKRLVDLWQKRQLASLPPVIHEELGTEKKTADNILAQMQDEINRIQGLIKDDSADRAVSVSNIFPEVMNDIEGRRGRGHGMLTGFEGLDDMLGGLQPALHILAGRPGLGKTTFAIQIATKVAQDGIPVVFLSFDEVVWRLTLKAFCQVSGLTMKKYADGKYNDQEYAELQKAYEDYSGGLQQLHFIEGSSRFEVPHLESIARQVIRRAEGANNCLVIVDYLQRWATNKKDKANFQHIVSGMVSELREMAFRISSPVIVVSSLSRDGYDEPTISSLKESGELEFSADTALFLRENYHGTERMRRIETSLTPRALRLVIAKNRYGSLGELSYQFNLQIGRIEEKA